MLKVDLLLGGPSNPVRTIAIAKSDGVKTNGNADNDAVFEYTYAIGKSGRLYCGIVTHRYGDGAMELLRLALEDAKAIHPDLFKEA